MNRQIKFRRAFVSTAIALATLGGCDVEDPDETGVSDDYDAFLETVYQEPETGIYIVDGDIPIYTEDDLHEYFLENVAEMQSRSIVHQWGATDAVWSDAQKMNLTYCVSTSFGSRYNQVVQAMDEATSVWEEAAEIDFIHVQGQDGNCTASNNAVVFDVRPVNAGGAYLARAFFPGVARWQRNILIDASSYTVSAPLDLEGILRHEVGHTLGFRHEHTRPDGVNNESSDWRPVTKHDVYSTMYYPHLGGEDGSLRLSARDKEGVGALYGCRPCTFGGFDSANCYVATPPSGSNPFIWSGNLYYTPQPGNQCPVPGTWYDGANCYAGTPPEGTDPFIYAGNLYYTRQCDPDGSETFGGSTWFEGADSTNTPLAGDFDNDGVEDDIVYYGRCGSGSTCWRAHISDGNGFEVTSLGASMWFQGSTPANAPVVGDFDNDGFNDDIAYYGRCGSGSNCWRVHRSNGSTFSVTSMGGSMWFEGSDSTNRPVAGDFDNDGYRDDIAYYGRCGSGSTCWRVHRGNGTTFSVTSMGAGMWFEGSDPTNTPVAGDFDNDGYDDDIAYYGRCGSGSTCWRVHRSNGSTFSTTSMGANMWFRYSDARSTPISGDFDGDGRRDDIAYQGRCGSGSTCWRIHQGNGSSLNSVYGLGRNIESASWTADNTPVAGDFNEDGKTDFAYYGKCGETETCWRTDFR